MYKVAFYIDNHRISDVDCSAISCGNPGIGGTEYLFYFTVLNLQISVLSDIKIRLLTSSDAKLPEMDYEMVGSKEDAISFCKSNGYDILVIKYEQPDYDSTMLSKENIMPLKLVVWAHNVIPNHILSRMECLGGISAIVNVGREQLDLYRDHNMFYKSTFIYNSLPIKSLYYYVEHSVPYRQRGHEVTYLGSLIPVKGFHILAKAWKDILKAVPDAHLNVIGSGKVYDSNARLGKYGIADESYEREFMPYLTDEKGEILKSVTFWGRLGKEKEKILAKTKVGVPNPAGTSETFCLSAVEMALWGARIVSKKYVGLIDTVPEAVGRLYISEASLVTEIISELTISDDRYRSSYDFIYRNFSINKIINKWTNLFYGLIEKNRFDYEKELVNGNYNFKNYREIVRKIKRVLPYGQNLITITGFIGILSKLPGLRRLNNLIKY